MAACNWLCTDCQLLSTICWLLVTGTGGWACTLNRFISGCVGLVMLSVGLHYFHSCKKLVSRSLFHVSWNSVVLPVAQYQIPVFIETVSHAFQMSWKFYCSSVSQCQILVSIETALSTRGFEPVQTTVKKTGHANCLWSEHAKCHYIHPPVYLFWVAINSVHFTMALSI